MCYVINTFWRECVQRKFSTSVDLITSTYWSAHRRRQDWLQVNRDFLLATSHRQHDETLIDDYRPAQRHMDDNESILLYWLTTVITTFCMYNTSSISAYWTARQHWSAILMHCCYRQRININHWRFRTTHHWMGQNNSTPMMDSRQMTAHPSTLHLLQEREIQRIRLNLESYNDDDHLCLIVDEIYPLLWMGVSASQMDPVAKTAALWLPDDIRKVAALATETAI